MAKRGRKPIPLLERNVYCEFVSVKLTSDQLWGVNTLLKDFVRTHKEKLSQIKFIRCLIAEAIKAYEDAPQEYIQKIKGFPELGEAELTKLRAAMKHVEENKTKGGDNEDA